MTEFKKRVEEMKTEKMNNGLTPQENEMILKESIKEFGQDTVTDGYKTLDIYNHIFKAIKNGGLTPLAFKQEASGYIWDLKILLSNIDFNYNIEIGNKIEADRGYPYFSNIKRNDNKFSKIFKKQVKAFIKNRENKKSALACKEKENKNIFTYSNIKEIEKLNNKILKQTEMTNGTLELKTRIKLYTYIENIIEVKHSLNTFLLRGEFEDDIFAISELLTRVNRMLPFIEKNYNYDLYSKENKELGYSDTQYLDLHYANITSLFSLKVNYYSITSSPELRINNSFLTLDEIRYVISKLCDKHVAEDSVNYIDKYTGERYNETTSYKVRKEINWVIDNSIKLLTSTTKDTFEYNNMKNDDIVYWDERKLVA